MLPCNFTIQVSKQKLEAENLVLAIEALSLHMRAISAQI